MNDGSKPARSEPVLELRELEEATSEDFQGRVRRSILRRSLAAEMVGYAWTAPFRIILEYIGLVLSALGDRMQQGDEDE